MCIYCPLVILIIDQFLNEHLTHISIKLLRVAGRGLSQLLSGISVFVTQFLAAPTPIPGPYAGVVQPIFPQLEEWIGYSSQSIGSTVLPGFKSWLFHKLPVWLPANVPYFSHAQDGDDDYTYLGGLGVCVVGGGEAGMGIE